MDSENTNKMKIVKLTGKPISQEMHSIITLLELGGYVSNSDIENTTEIKLARACINNSISTINIKGREELQAGVIDILLQKGSAVIDEDGKVEYNGIVESNSRLDIVIGLPASGKSSALVDVLSEEYHSRVIDNDEAKKLIPEFNTGWGADIVHDESKLIETAVIRRAITNHDNIVLPKIGSNIGKLLDVIRMAKKAGYNVNVHYVELNRNKALGRMLNRFIEQGRFLDPKIIDKYDNDIDGNKITKVYEIIKKGGVVDGYSRWNNDVERGEQPILIETNCTGKYIERAKTSSNYDAIIRDDRESRGSFSSRNLVYDRTRGRNEEHGYTRISSDTKKGNVSGSVKRKSR